MVRLRLLLPLLLLIALPLAACGGGSNKNNDATAGSSSGGSSSSSNGQPLSDEAYLKVFCTGINNYADALNTAKSADGIAQVIKDYIAQLKKVTPPTDLQQYQQQYIKYLSDAVDNPTSLVSQNPPEPPQKVRDRLASKVQNVPECKYKSFLGDFSVPTPGS